MVIPDVTRDRRAVNIRKFVVRASHLDDLVRLGTMTSHAAAFLHAAVRAGLNVLVAGGTQAGKTTLLNCLGGAIDPHERVITCEEVFEPCPAATWCRCSAGRRASRAPARSGCGVWSRSPFACVPRASWSARCGRRSRSTCCSR
ncbi:hypothetical protein GCM10025868_12220 [Angustibacter aerolatus]|uniref:Bacterial type II secretion system protein E domain-containing protein n=1 Tax=Angustibacter aerolatus TaxID=1162965 RepID=A0ABQ6JDV1_9ACTN|nr:ATPase, T2SS/T4P/T4SS family [Angustibacter aerolatus]GMA85972.1 hypothetical protein GCM10025868_12220 [Angustibacter aerolatus]